jgi:hypothetical protein
VDERKEKNWVLGKGSHAAVKCAKRFLAEMTWEEKRMSAGGTSEVRLVACKKVREDARHRVAVEAIKRSRGGEIRKGKGAVLGRMSPAAILGRCQHDSGGKMANTNEWL